MTIEVVENAQAIGQRAAELLLEKAQVALREGRRCRIALSGGTTPRYLYEALVKAAPQHLQALQGIDWYFSDERFVPHDDPQSNSWLAQTHLFSKVALDQSHIFRVPTQLAPEQAALAYEATVGQQPFDLVFLGMGDDGHTASLFPENQLVSQIISKRNSQRVAATFVPKVKMDRITFTPLLINAAKTVVIMAAGASKAEVLSRVLEGPHDPLHLPVQLVRPVSGTLYWLVDQDAAKR